MRNTINTTNSTLASLILIALLGVYAIGGAQEGTWTKKADMPTARAFHATSVVDGKIYVIGGGGEGPVARIDEYNPLTGNWARKADMPTPRGGLAAAVVNGKIYALGGWTGSGGVLSTVEEYDPETDIWTPKADMPTPRLGLAAAVVIEKIYAIGGKLVGGGPSSVISAVEVYDPATDTWTKRADTLVGFGFSTSVLDGEIYAIGGSPDNAGIFSKAVQVYDPTTDTWTRKADMSTGRWWLSTSIVNRKIYAIGGSRFQGFVRMLSTVEVYDPATDSWTQKPDMPTARDGLSTSAVNGFIYAIGGESHWGDTFPFPALSTVEAYDLGVGVRVSALSPDVGRIDGGEPIAISGSGFPPEAVVAIGDNPLIELKVTDTLISGLTPPGTAGEQQILITAPSIDFIVFAGTFRYTAPGRPIAVSITPSQGLQSGGQQGVIEGAGFQPGLTITIGTAKAPDVVVTPTRITFTMPASNRPGTLVVAVENPGGGASRQVEFTYISLPDIAELQPNKGPVEGGTDVTLFGKNLMPQAVVTIGDVKVETVEFLAFTRLRFFTPPNTAGAKAVKVINPDGQETVKDGAFTYEAPELAVEPQWKLPTTLGKVKYTTLLQNYPNPFNPETWIPYVLAEEADVTVRIYSINGELIRTLEVGKQPRGIYVSPERAVYWDGTDDAGAPVASGVYFYQLHVSSEVLRSEGSEDSARSVGTRSQSIGTGAFRQTRRMVLVK